ncbi:outer membrane receptor for ferrienterochelin and colicin [Parabacteroides sp. PF5-5]|uniref:TonB-dependent receptor n=1 Tax=unclassified Parabacteroides TaxID=2649774 RepID=UPI002475B850|nr:MULTISPECIES: TonB-dependent receptor [unclassified Parabacteroides]MDH6304669.1 outer membrane receptor for ferrienterochelin and colicin [Parabacteroides sp. PH5-39]MDH6315717.1 outer membrane receptor for ferrienterochelin and colicin [Parabacteroides sp. PF5-13]MDH6319377.1 outer membrane receptor for ferrienterochelin and colicin [Parabacteroides sp. PH5-13]MDH6323108.1 outer membrane receptor for ferrienterochelin and colicin [Parabacteroides sp. PH5-8]MDH6326910.1 outer membrane rece
MWYVICGKLLTPYPLLLTSLLLLFCSFTPIPLVTIDMKQVDVEDVFLELEKQTGLFFSYESSLLDEFPKVSLTVKDESLSSCLKKLFANLPVVYKVANGYIILKRKPRQYTISGFVRDSVSYESLINATVIDCLSGKGGVSNNYGFYSITLPAGKVVLRSSYVGYQTKEIPLYLDRDTLIDIPLCLLGALQEVVVRGNNPHSEVMSSRMGNIELSSGHLSKVPSLFGEPDLIRTFQQMPGVASGTEILGGMFVRGGNGDDNLFLIDGIPVYNVNHVAGLFSTFNPDVVKNVDFYKGGFPARYGGRLSSVVDVRLKDGDMQQYHGNVSIGLLAAKANIEGPIVKDRTSFNVAFRRTWLDALSAPAFAIINNTRKNEDVFVGYSFYDLNAKINHIFTPKSRLYANFYMGQDRLRYTYWHNITKLKQGTETIWRWGNLVTSLNWTYIFNQKLFGNFNTSYSRYRSKMQEEEKTPIYWGSNMIKDIYSSHNSGIEDLGYRFDMDYSPTPNHRIRFGADYLYHIYRPEDKTMHAMILDLSTTYAYNQLYNNPIIYAHEWSIYAEDDWLLHDKWKANMGARLNGYQVDGKTYLSLQPRISLRYLITHDLSLKASYVKMDQYVHQLSNTYANLPSDIWVPVTANVKPQNSHLFSFGAYYKLKKTYDLSVEGYYKRMDNLIEYQDNALLFPDYVDWDKKISMGEGRSYGAEFMARKSEGRTSGWVSYTLSWSDRIFHDRLVNEGRRFPAKYDNRHKLNVTVIHKFSPKVDLSASWTYASGNRVTVVIDSYLSHQTGNSYPGYIHDEAGYYLPVNTFEGILGRNAAKLGDYHRLDLSLNIYRPKKKGRMGIWNVSLYNVYSRMNPFYIEDTYLNQDGRFTIRQKGIIPVIPSVSYTYKF